MDFTDKWFFITGVANKKSVATFIAKSLQEKGAKLIFSAQNEANLKQVEKLFPDSPRFILDVENPQQVAQLNTEILKHTNKLDGLLHSMAFANFAEGIKSFVDTRLEDFLQATHISCFSLVQITQQLKSILDPKASIVTIGISNTKATSYGYLGPIKAMLETTVTYLAKSLSEIGQIRVNCVSSGPLKTSASAGLPDYIDNYLYSQALTLRKKNLETAEVANTAVFLLSPLASGINGEKIVVDAGMNANYFDQDIVKSFANSLK